MARHKKKTLYQKSLLTFIVLILMLSVFCWVYVYLTMVEYEKSNIDNYMDSIISDLSKNPSKYLELNTKYETNSSIKKSLKENKIEFKQVDSKDNSKYYLYIDANKDASYSTGEEFAQVTLDNSNTVKKLGMLTYNKWSIKEVEGITGTIKIYAPTDAKVNVNGITLTNSDVKDSSKIIGLEEAYDYVDLPKVNYYEIDGIIISPVVESKDNKVTYEDGAYIVDNYFTTEDISEAMQKLTNNYNPLEFTRTWQMFLRAEYSGEKGRGLYKVSPNLIEGTSMYKKAKDWATNVDITFTSIHTLDSTPFTNEKISNITVYNDIAFSCDVYSEMNMTLKSGMKVNEKFNERIYFVYYDGAYRVVAMKSIKE